MMLTSAIIDLFTAETELSAQELSELVPSKHFSCHLIKSIILY